MEVVNRNGVEPFITKDNSEIREILAPSNSSIKNQSLAEARLTPGQSTDEHFHPKSEEIYYILEGRGRMKVEDEERESRARRWHCHYRRQEAQDLEHRWLGPRFSMLLFPGL